MSDFKATFGHRWALLTDQKFLFSCSFGGLGSLFVESFFLQAYFLGFCLTCNYWVTVIIDHFNAMFSVCSSLIITSAEAHMQNVFHYATSPLICALIGKHNCSRYMNELIIIVYMNCKEKLDNALI